MRFASCLMVFVLMPVPHQPNGFGQLHHGQGNQNQPQAHQVQPAGQQHQPESDAHRGEQHQAHQRQAQQGGAIQLLIGEGTDGEERALAAHVEGLNNLG